VGHVSEHVGVVLWCGFKHPDVNDHKKRRKRRRMRGQQANREYKTPRKAPSFEDI
jgi:hypothetical protein